MIKLLVVSDVHVGSMYANWPEYYPIKGGAKWKLNQKQGIIKEAWDEFTKWSNQEKPDILVLNGDIIEGHQEATKGMPTVTTDLGEQMGAALEILEPLVNRVPEIYVTRGTSYHDRSFVGPPETIGRELGAVQVRRKQYSDWVINIDVGGVIANFAHTISVATGLYRSTPLDREGVWAALAGRHKVPDADVIVRSHVHIFCHVEHSSRHLIITPCWQYQTEYQINKSYYRMQPEIGAVMLRIYPERKKEGEDAIEVQKILVKLPREKATISSVYRGEAGKRKSRRRSYNS